MVHFSRFLGTPPNNGRFHTVAIDGRGGSGKSQLAAYMEKLLPAYTVINGDDYFEPTEGELAWGRFNDARFVSDVLLPVSRGEDFTYRPYDWHSEPHITERHVAVTSGFVLDRCFSFGMPFAWDVRIWVETPRELCLRRGMERDDFDPERSWRVWTELWQPREDTFIATIDPAAVASFVVDGTAPFEDQVAN